MAARATLEAPAARDVGDGTRAIVIGGLVVGAVLGFGGNFVDPGETQDILYGVSAVGLMLASVLLALGHASTGHRYAAAGFALLALGEMRVLGPTEAPGAEASFAAGVLIYSPALLLIALSAWAPVWVRAVGAMAALPFAAHGLAFLGGADIDSTDPLAGMGYALLTITVVGWILTVLRSSQAAAARPDPSRSGGS